VAGVLSRRENLRVVVSGDVGLAPRSLLDHEHVTALTDDVPKIDGLTAQIRVGDSDPPGAGRPLWLLESACAGLPTVFLDTRRGDVDDPVVCAWRVDDRADVTTWCRTTLAAIAVADNGRGELAGRGELLFGPKASRSLVNRIIGWAGFASGDR
jgi:hypothetical protein